MSYKRTEHKKAIVKMVREKRMILQMDMATLMNKTNINYSIKSLVEEGKIRRQKIKNRGIVGNLTDVWLVYSNEVKQDEILEFEKKMINKPFVSPLVKNHCYKRPEKPIEQELKLEEQTAENNNVVDLQKYVKINNTDIQIVEYNNQKVVTAYEISELHNREVKRVTEQFERNKKYFIKDVDYFVISRENAKVADCDFKKYFKSPRQKEIYLYTQTGYLMLVKSFTDDLSWSIQRDLVNKYFMLENIKEKYENNVPITKPDLDINTYDILKVFATGITDLNDRVKTLENTMESFRKAITG